MGFFARFRRKGKESAGVAAEESSAVAVITGPETAAGEPGATDTPPAADATDRTAHPAHPTRAAATEPGAAAEGLEIPEIPKQQSAEEAADNEAGEGARK